MEEHWILSIIQKELTTLQHALSCLKHIKPQKYQDEFYYAKVGIRYLAMYLKSCQDYKIKNPTAKVPIHHLLNVIDVETFIWACDFFFKDKNTKECKHIKEMYELLQSKKANADEIRL